MSRKSEQDTQELRELFSHDTTEWKAIRDEAAIDMRHIAGDPWDPKDRQAREAAGRPCLSLDELSQFTNQVVNEVRANKRAVKFAPVGDGANDDTAEFYADKMREIEYRSRAQIAYTTAFENAVQRSYGFVRISTRYESPRSANQDIWIDQIPNPDLVTPDPYALMPDMSDQKHCWVREPWRVEDFNRKWPDAKLEGRALSDLTRDFSAWISDKQVMVAEHWKIKYTKRTLLIVRPDQVAAPQAPGQVLGLQSDKMPEPVGVFEDELEENPIQGRILTTREVEDPSVYQCLTNGVEILEENPWLGRYIPIVSCLGKVIYLDEGAGSRRRILSMVRLARDPYMLYCYYRTCEAELVGMTPKFPYFARRGSLSPDQLIALQKSLHEPVAVIEVENMIPGMGQTPPEFPQRQPYEPPIQALEIGAESARRAIQAAIGQSPLPTQAQRRNEKSGVALKHIEETGQRGSFHFTDHYLDMIQHVGVVVEDLLDKIYDTARDVGIRKANDTAEVIRINDPNSPKSVNTKGRHLVTVSTGPSFDSEREAASDFADTLAQISPEVFGLLGPLIVKLKNLGPIGDEMAELLEAVQPPPVQAMRAEKAKQGDPAQAAKELVMVKAKLQEVMQAAQQMQQVIETEQVKQQATLQKAQMDAQTTLAVAKLRESTALAVAKLQALVKPELEAEAKAIEGDVEREHELVLSEVEHAHALELEKLKAQTAAIHAEQAQQHALVKGEQGHAHAVEQGERSHDHALEAGDRQVAGKMAIEKAKPKPQSKEKD